MPRIDFGTFGRDARSGVWEADDYQKTYEDLKARGIDALFKDGCGNRFSLREHPKE